MKSLPLIHIAIFTICAVFARASGTAQESSAIVRAVDVWVMEQGNIKLGSLSRKEPRTQLWRGGDSGNTLTFSAAEPIGGFNIYTGYSVKVTVTETAHDRFDLKVSGYASFFEGFTEYEPEKFTPVITSLSFEDSASVRLGGGREVQPSWHAIPILGHNNKCLGIVFFRLRYANEADIAAEARRAKSEK